MGKFIDKFVELFEQQDGALCIIQTVIAFSFIMFWGVWAYICIKLKSLIDVPPQIGLLLAAMLASKVWKDINDNKAIKASSPTGNLSSS